MKKLKKKLLELYQKEMFNPSYYFGVFINPYFIIRRSLFKCVKSYSNEIKGKMIDIGCGSKPYEKLFDVEKYIGLDIEVSGHDHTNELVDCYYDGKTIPYKDNSFDSAFSSEVFEHIFNLEEILNEIQRVLKPKGKLLITVPFVWEEHEIPHDFARYTSFGIISLLEKHGFKILESKKNTSNIETIFQLLATYINSIFCHNKFPLLNIILRPFVVSPFIIIGILLSIILPNNNAFYHNNIILCERT